MWGEHIDRTQYDDQDEAQRREAQVMIKSVAALFEIKLKARKTKHPNAVRLTAHQLERSQSLGKLYSPSDTVELGNAQIGYPAGYKLDGIVWMRGGFDAHVIPLMQLDIHWRDTVPGAKLQIWEAVVAAGLLADWAKESTPREISVGGMALTDDGQDRARRKGSNQEDGGAG